MGKHDNIDKKNKILVVLDFINCNSGVSSVVMNYYCYMSDANIHMDFLLYEEPEEPFARYIKRNGSKIYSLGHPTKLGVLKYKYKVEEFFEKHKGEYSIVHVHIPNTAFLVLKYAKKYDIKTRIIHSHNSRGGDDWKKKVRNYLLNQQGIRYANQYYACSKAAGEFLYGKNSGDKYVVVNNAIDMKKYQYDRECRLEIRKSLGIKQELVLGHVGRFSEQKNHRFLIEIAKQLKLRDINFKMILLGDGELMSVVKAQVQLAGLEEQVCFVGITSDVKKYMDAMDILLLPSFYEGLPCVCIEAQANGLPCIVSDSVSREVAISSEIQFVKIDHALEWVKIILQHDVICDRIQKQDFVWKEFENYDIVIQAKVLEERYLSYTKN